MCNWYFLEPPLELYLGQHANKHTKGINLASTKKVNGFGFYCQSKIGLKLSAYGGEEGKPSSPSTDIFAVNQEKLLQCMIACKSITKAIDHVHQIMIMTLMDHSREGILSNKTDWSRSKNITFFPKFWDTKAQKEIQKKKKKQCWKAD